MGCHVAQVSIAIIPDVAISYVSRAYFPQQWQVFVFGVCVACVTHECVCVCVCACVCVWHVYAAAYLVDSVCLESTWYGLLHLECHLISIFNLNLIGLFSTERGKRDLQS